jgi:hypothetical protein
MIFAPQGAVIFRISDFVRLLSCSRRGEVLRWPFTSIAGAIDRIGRKPIREISAHYLGDAPMIYPSSRSSGLIGMVLLGSLLVPVQAIANHIWIVRELPNEAGVQTSIDGQIFNSDPGSETQLVGANLNDGNYVPQIINVNLYEDAAHTIVSDRLDISVPAQNPPQINVGLTSDTDGVPLLPLAPENLALTETGDVQFVVSLTNSNGVRTDIFVQSDVLDSSVPEPSSAVLLAVGFLGLLGFAWHRRKRTIPV